MGNDLPYPILWDNLLLDACQVTNPSIDPLREPMELRTFLGRKPDQAEVTQTKDGPSIRVETGPHRSICKEQIGLAVYFCIGILFYELFQVLPGTLMV